jgi:hypothetical protein
VSHRGIGQPSLEGSIMQETLDQALQAWHDFYILTGTIAGALVGLQFVSSSLAASILPKQDKASISAFVTPTIIHFTAVAVTASVLTIPLPGEVGLGILLGLISLVGLWVVLQPARNLWVRRRQQPVKPVHLAWYVGLPMCCYLTIGITALTLLAGGLPPLLPQGLAIILLLVIGIRNAWDLFIWIYAQRQA